MRNSRTRFAPDGAEADALKVRAIARIRERMLQIEAAVVGPWLLAHEFSAADIYVAMFSQWSIGKEWRKSHLPKINTLVDALASRPRIAPVWQKHFG